MKNLGVAKVSFEFLERAMAMPADHKIISITVGWNFQPFFNVIIEGPQMPEHRVEEEVQKVEITIQQHELEWIKVEPVK